MSKNRSKLVGILITLILISNTSNAQDLWRFIITGDSRGSDTGVNSVILSEIADEIVSRDVDLFLFAGDLITGNMGMGSSTLEEQLVHWLDIMSPVYDAGIGVYVIRGNHEDGNFFPDVSVWHDVMSGPYAMPNNGPANEGNLTYSVSHKNAFIAGLDQYVNENRVNQAWLDGQLAANSNPHVFVFGHLPAFRSMPRECLDSYPQKRDAFWMSLKDAGARMYFCSHDHYYDHARIDDADGDAANDLHQYIIGTAGAPLYSYPITYEGDNSSMVPVNVHRREGYGYVLVEIDGLDVSVRWMQRNTLDWEAEGYYDVGEVWEYSVPAITLVSPNGGEELIAGQDFTISWQRYEHTEIEQVRLEYFDGVTWNSINAEPVEAVSGSYFWESVAGVDSEECLVRISDWNNASLSDVSDSNLTIYQCRPLLGDLNKDCYVNMKDLMLFVSDWLKCGNAFDPECIQ